MKPPSDDQAQGRQAISALGHLTERIAPWLVEVGTWVFGGLIALNLVIIAALITVGPVDLAVLIAALAFACALPLEVAGIVLLRLSKDVDDFRLEKATLESFEDAKFPNIRSYFPPPREREPARRRRSRIALGYALGIAVLSTALTVGGIVGALWHMAPWVAESFLAALFLSALLIILVIRHAMPPVSVAERRLQEKAND